MNKDLQQIRSCKFLQTEDPLCSQRQLSGMKSWRSEPGNKCGQPLYSKALQRNALLAWLNVNIMGIEKGEGGEVFSEIVPRECGLIRVDMAAKLRKLT